jgi:predicted transcriptional regulator
MHEKGHVGRDETDRSHVYHARIPEEQVQQTLMDSLLERAFGGSAQKLVMRALSAKKTSAAERAEIRKFLDELERKQKEKKTKA